MSNLPREERLQILLTRAELEALDNWRFAHRMPSRAAAIRELLKRGLAAAGNPAVAGSRSRDFRVVREDDTSPAAKPGRGNGGSSAGRQPN